MMRPARRAPARRPMVRRPPLRPVRVSARPRRTSAPDLLPEEVLRIIRSHPEGASAVDVGNELGINWRRVLGVMRTLVQAGALEQVQEQFYAVSKASRK